jgi:hypothetical protein
LDDVYLARQTFAENLEVRQFRLFNHVVTKHYSFLEDKVEITSVPLSWRDLVQSNKKLSSKCNFMTLLDEDYEAALMIRDEIWPDPLKYYPVCSRL